MTAAYLGPEAARDIFGAIFTSSAFERRFRDIHTVTQQLQGRQAHLETVGRYLPSA
jgi:hypothetical protein